MNQTQPGSPELPSSLSGRKASRRRFIVWAALASAVVVALGLAAVFWFLRSRDNGTEGGAQNGDAGTTESWLDAKDFSGSNSVSVVLGEKQSGQGLEHIATERDGLTAVGVFKGVRCRYLNLQSRNTNADAHGYFYFAVDPSFKQQETNRVRIEVEYYNEKRVTITLQYDACAKTRSASSIYTRPAPAVSCDPASRWKTAIYHVRDGAFAGRQNGGADFRLRVSPPELYVRRVSVTRETADDPRIGAVRSGESGLNATGYYASNSVRLDLGEQESGNGLDHIATERDGLTAVGTVKGVRCRYLNLSPRAPRGDPHGYFYFAIDSTFKRQDTNSVKVEVEYYSEKRGALALQYDARVAAKTLKSIYTRAGPAVALDGAKEWETATFHLRDAAFEGSQNGGADFRFEVLPPELYIRRVTITREQEDGALPVAQ